MNGDKIKCNTTQKRTKSSSNRSDKPRDRGERIRPRGRSAAAALTADQPQHQHCLSTLHCRQIDRHVSLLINSHTHTAPENKHI